jgi:transcription elongation factor GreA
MQELQELSQEGARTAALRDLARQGKFGELETIWIDEVGKDLNPERLSGLLDAAAEVLARGDRALTGALLELLLPALGGPGVVVSEPALRLHELLVRLFPQKRAYRAAYCECLEALFSPSTPERAFYSVSRVADSGDPVAALDRFQKLAKFRAGACVYHPSGWGVGEVLAVDPYLKQVRVNLEHKKDHRIAMDAVDSILEPLDDDSFRALAYRGSEALRRLADEDPARLIAKVLQTFGNPLMLKEIKSQLVPGVIALADWSRWWNRAKSALRDSGFYRVADRSPYTVERLDAAVSYEDDLLATLARASPSETLQVARQVFRAGAEALPRAFDLARQKLLTAVEGSSAAARTGAGAAIEAGAVLARGAAGDETNSTVAALLSRLSPAQVASGLEDLSSSEEIRGMTEVFRSSCPQSWQDFSKLAFTSTSDPLRQAVLALFGDEDRGWVVKIAADVCTSPRLAPEAFCWLLDQLLRGRKLAVLDPLAGRSPRDLVVMLLDLAQYVLSWESRRGRASLKDLFRRFEGLFEHDGMKFFQDGAREMLPDERVEAHACLVRCAELMPRVALRLIEILRDLEPSISAAKEGPVWEDDSIIFTTEAGLARKRAELRELTEVKLPKVFQAIGDAARFGDLSENAEFTSALEERDHLTKRASRIEEELKRAQIIHAEDLESGVVGLGSSVRVLNLDQGEERSYKLLGPWDGGIDEGVLNYRSPLGLGFLGKRVGEEVRVALPGGEQRFSIVEVGSALEAGA